jgi:hypothetical protein
LVSADNGGAVVLPQHKNIFIAVFQKKFLCGKVEIRINGMCVYDYHENSTNQ